MHARTRPDDSRRGFTVLETLIAGVVVAVGLTGFAAAMVAAHDLRELTHEGTVALNSVRYVVEEVEFLANFDYVRDNLNGFTFRVPELRGPDLSEPFPGGEYPSFYPSTGLPRTDGSILEVPTYPSSEFDSVMSATYDPTGIGLEPAWSYEHSERAYGTVQLTTVSADMVRLEISIEFGSSRGNRRIRYNTYVMRELDPESWTW